ncbi:MAG TPA: MG2 domain-containing protein, partial [Calditrichia bacterium]|nr:MG2 domain-containing protein [Calditrichia bacterium]
APGGINAFIYTDRGVYRPGDMVHLSVVARNDAHTFPDNHPVSVRIYNPRNQKRYEETHNDGKDGFYAFSFDSKPDDLTGTWRVEVVAGSKTFHHDLKIETVVPFRLKVNLSSETKRFSPGQGALELDLNSTYLFGNPAANLDAEVEMNLSKSPLKAPKYDGFVFDHEAREFRSVQTNLYRGRLDADGNAIIRYNMPTLQEAPSRLMATFTAKVFEKGGRPNTGILNIPVDPFPYYVGLQKPELDWGYARVGATLSIPTILLDGEGQPAAGRQLTYRIYQGEEYWWYDFDNLEDYQMRFKRQSSTKLLKQESVLSQSLPARIDFAPDKEGYYLVEVQDGPDGHMAGFFFYASSWGRGAAGKDAGVLALKTDKEEYRPGETATLTFPAPREGGILFTLERGSEILDERWYAAGGGEEMNIEFAIREDMAPNCYATVAILQPHAQTANDRPIRLYGVVPVKVTAPETQQLITLETPASLRPNEPFTVKLATSDGKPTQFTLAVVDEGLLDITRFKTPDPWAHFFRKIRLGVASYDLFNEVIGAHKGDVLRVFSIGGGMMEAYRDSQMGDKETQRFKPVALFRGPLKTDNNGKASISFDMPNYVGSVRVMAVAARGNTYGSAQKTVPVKTELMAVTSLPRVLGPGDRFTMPATVFAMEKNIGDVKVTLDLQGPLKPLSEKQTTLSFSAVGEKDWLVDLEADTAIGPAKI